MFSRKIIFSLLGVVLLSASAQVEASAALGRAARTVARSVGFNIGMGVGLGVTGVATAAANWPEKSDYSKWPTLALQAQQMLLRNRWSNETLEQKMKEKAKNAKPGYIIAPPLAGLALALCTSGVAAPVLVGVATGAAYGQLLLDAPVFGDKPIRNEIVGMAQDAMNLDLIDAELSKPNRQ